ncbi:GNAT family N-acetyltransferase [Paenibacillus sp. GCM10027626]|uniref:GNAT family N-acetyltransferase n=1 Tax=Paenibacillus sp. GCM10027626 TaxID=3273411 RepID=UPI00363DCE78
MTIIDSSYFWQGTKIRLRATQRSDWEQWKLESTDSEAIRLMEWGIELPKNDIDVAETSDRFDNFKDNFRKMFAIETLSNNQLVGFINLNSLDHKNGVFSFGLGVNRGYRNNGYATEATRIIMRYGFYELRMQKCNSSCVEINEASLKFHRNLGFIEEGRRRRIIYMDGKFYDNILLGVTREEFDEIEKQYSNNKNQ